MRRLSRLRFVYASISLLLIVLAATPRMTSQSVGGGPRAATNAPKSLSPAHPISRAQLEVIQRLFRSSDVQMMQLHVLLESERRKLPVWFPVTVWSDVEQHVERIDGLEISLPIYRKYLSGEDARALILFYHGETGERLAQAISDHMLESLRSGHPVGPPISKDDSASAPGSVAFLMNQRLNELTADERASCLQGLKAFNSVIRRANEEVRTHYIDRVKVITRTVIADHAKEINEAQIRSLKANP
jgi:hypothetical protein